MTSITEAEPIKVNAGQATCEMEAMSFMSPLPQDKKKQSQGQN